MRKRMVRQGVRMGKMEMQQNVNAQQLPVALSAEYNEMMRQLVAMEQIPEPRRLGRSAYSVDFTPATTAPRTWLQALSCVQNSYLMSLAQ